MVFSFQFSVLSFQFWLVLLFRFPYSACRFLLYPLFPVTSESSTRPAGRIFPCAFVLKLHAECRRIEVSLENGFSKLQFISHEQRFPRPREASLPPARPLAGPQDTSQHGTPRVRARARIRKHRRALPSG